MSAPAARILCTRPAQDGEEWRVSLIYLDLWSMRPLKKLAYDVDYGLRHPYVDYGIHRAIVDEVLNKEERRVCWFIFEKNHFTIEDVDYGRSSISDLLICRSEGGSLQTGLVFQWVCIICFFSMFFLFFYIPILHLYVIWNITMNPILTKSMYRFQDAPFHADRGVQRGHPNDA